MGSLFSPINPSLDARQSAKRINPNPITIDVRRFCMERRRLAEIAVASDENPLEIIVQRLLKDIKTLLMIKSMIAGETEVMSGVKAMELPSFSLIFRIFPFPFLLSKSVTSLVKPGGRGTPPSSSFSSGGGGCIPAIAAGFNN